MGHFGDLLGQFLEVGLVFCLVLFGLLVGWEFFYD